MNITDFVDSIKLQLSDLMQVGELGYVEGISKIIVKNLNNLDETIRPVHCTDKKRETMYVKDEGEWTKEDENKTRLKKAIIRVANKNIRLLPQFREKYPEYKNSSSKISDIHDKLVIEVMETDDDKKEQIIKKISNATTISKA
jgi:actin-related protein